MTSAPRGSPRSCSESKNVIRSIAVVEPGRSAAGATSNRTLSTAGLGGALPGVHDRRVVVVDAEHAAPPGYSPAIAGSARRSRSRRRAPRRPRQAPRPLGQLRRSPRRSARPAARPGSTRRCRANARRCADATRTPPAAEGRAEVVEALGHRRRTSSGRPRPARPPGPSTNTAAAASGSVYASVVRVVVQVARRRPARAATRGPAPGRPSSGAATCSHGQRTGAGQRRPQPAAGAERDVSIAQRAAEVGQSTGPSAPRPPARGPRRAGRSRSSSWLLSFRGLGCVVAFHPMAREAA